MLAGNRPGDFDTNGVRYVVRGRVCYLYAVGGGSWPSSDITSTARAIATLPDGVRPLMPVEGAMRVPGNAGSDAALYVLADGRVMAMAGKATRYFRGFVAFPIA